MIQRLPDIIINGLCLASLAYLAGWPGYFIGIILMLWNTGDGYERRTREENQQQ